MAVVAVYDPRFVLSAVFELGEGACDLETLATLSIPADDAVMTGCAEILTLNLFEDMTLSDGWICDYVDVTQRQGCDDFYKPISVSVESLEGYAGEFEPDTGRIAIDRDVSDTVLVLSHELIHLWETRLRALDFGYSDLVLVHLLDEVRGKSPCLAKVAMQLMKSDGYNDISARGGGHSLLFLLKSYDIDMRMGWPLGRTFGYDGYASAQGDCGCDYADR